MSNFKNRGFGSMTLERRREVAAKAGRASAASGKGHKWDSEEGRKAALKGAKAKKRKRLEQSKNDNPGGVGYDSKIGTTKRKKV